MMTSRGRKVVSFGVSILGIAVCYELAQQHDRAKTENNLSLCVGAFGDEFLGFPQGVRSASLPMGTNVWTGTDVERRLTTFGVRACGVDLGACCPFPVPNGTTMTLTVWRNGEDRVFGLQRDSAGYLLTLSAPSVIPWRGPLYAQATHRSQTSGRAARWIVGPVSIGDGDMKVRDLYWTVPEDPDNLDDWEVQYTLALQNTGFEALTAIYGVRFFGADGKLLQTEILNPIEIPAGKTVVTTKSIQVSIDRGLEMYLGHVEAQSLKPLTASAVP